MQRVNVKHTQSVELAAPLKAYIKSNYGQTDLPEIEPAVADIQRAREMVARAVASQSIGGEAQRAVTELCEYLGMLRGLQSRFPFGHHEAGGVFRKKKVTTVMVQFAWTDSYRLNKLMAGLSLEFEMSSVAFNIGALNSFMGFAQDRSSAEGSSAAGKFFQKAAGVFELMSAKMSMPPTRECMDLSASSLKMLALMNLAQAACCSFEAAVMKKMKPAILAMLAQGVSDAYDRVRDVIRSDEELYKWMNKGQCRYMDHFTYQKRCLEAAAQYWQAHKDEEDGKYGDLVARYAHAKSVVESAEKYEIDSDSLKDSRLKLHSSISLKLKSAVKDNDTIYHYPVPNKEDLAPIQSKVITKPVPFELPDAKLPAAFDQLVPLVVQQSVDRFKSELGDEIGQIAKMCADSTDVAKASLEQLNLPAALDACEAKVTLPKDLWGQIQAAQQAGGLKSLEESRAKIRETAQQCIDMHREITNLLDKESQEELKLRNQFGTRWDRTPSHEITGSYRNELQSASQYLGQAREADSKVDKNLSMARLGMQVFTQSKAELEASIPELDSSVQSASSDHLRSLLRKLSSLLNKREKLVATFIESVEKHDAIGIVVPQMGVANVDELLKQEKTVFQSHRDAIDVNLAKQGELMEEIVDTNQKRLEESKKDSAQVDERTQVLKRMYDAVAAHEKLVRETAEGEKFYNDLLSNFLSPLEDNVRGFVVAREHEARLLLDDLSRQFASSASISQGSSPSLGHAQPGPGPQGYQAPQGGYPSFGGGYPGASAPPP